MAKRLCLGFGAESCGTLTDKRRCPKHHRMYEAHRRPTARQRGYTAEYERERGAVLANSTVCHLCGHEGADQADHLVPVSRGGARGPKRPAHGTKPCPTCGIRCNQSRGAKPTHTE